MLQSMGLQRIRQDLGTEQKQNNANNGNIHESMTV